MEHTEKEIDFVMTLYQMAKAFGYSGRILPKNERTVTGKWFKRKRKEIMAFARESHPEAYVGYLASRNLPEPERMKLYGITPPHQTETQNEEPTPAAVSTET